MIPNLQTRVFLFKIKSGLAITLIALAAISHLPSQSYSMYVGPSCNEGDLISSPYFGPKIAFISNVGSKDVNDFSLFTVNSDGSGSLVKIGKVSSRNMPVLLSSDGKKIAFTGLVDGTNQVFAGNTDGTMLLQITHDNKPKSAIAISPDGKKIVYAIHPYNEIGAVSNFFAIDSDGTNQIQLTTNSDEKAWPAVSADGTVLVFNDISNRTISKIFDVRTDGKNLHYITDGSLFSHVPEIISSDGSKIVFSRYNQNDSNTKYLFTINTDGTGLVKILPYPIYSQSDFTISPDGSKVAFDDNNIKESHVSVVNSDGTGYATLHDSANFMSMPLFSSDGSKLLFFSPIANNVTLFVADTDKKHSPVEISRSWYLGGQMFSKDGSKIIFSNYTNGTMQAYLTGLDGKNPIPLIDNSYFKPNPECKIPSDNPESNSYIQDSAFLPSYQEDSLILLLLPVIIAIISVAIIGIFVYFFKIRKRRK